MFDPAPPPTIGQIQDARELLAGRIERSPVVATGEWLFKAEYSLPTGSFKVRGATVALQKASIDGHRRVVAASAGNHGQGIGWAARALGIKATIVVPPDCPAIKLAKMRALCEVRVHDELGYDAAEAAARELAERESVPFVSPFDDTWVMAGNGGTMVLELLEQVPQLGTLVVPVGGGGLFSGVAAALSELRPEVKLVATQSEASPAFARSLRDDKWYASWPAAPTLAEGLEGGVGRTAVELARALNPEVIVTSEDEIRQAMIDLQRMLGTPIEGSGAVVLAAMRRESSSSWPTPVVGVLTGGNVAAATLEALSR